MSFRSERDRAALVRAFLAQVPHSPFQSFWTEDGPTELAHEYLRRAGVLTNAQLVLLRVAFDVWDGSGNATVADLLTVLDNRLLRLTLGLIAARCNDPDAYQHLAGLAGPATKEQ